LADRKKTERDRHKHLTGEHRLGDAGQIVLVVAFLAVWVIDSFFLRSTTFLNVFVPLVVRIVIGILLLVMSAYFARNGLNIVFGQERQSPTVIREGVFGIVRHPIYLSEIILYLGLLAFSISLAAAVVWLAAIGFLHYISRYEERLLLAQFGAEYERYMQDVPMWIPRPKRK
jgi:protein-S-isoprenylcysteine O-methyltransferase Ste14